MEGDELHMDRVSSDANNELNVSINDDNENIEVSNVDNDILEGNISSLIDDASLEQIENELGGLPNVDILPGLFTEGSSVTSSKRRRVSLTSSLGSSIPCAQPFSFPSETSTSEIFNSSLIYPLPKIKKNSSGIKSKESSM